MALIFNSNIQLSVKFTMLKSSGKSVATFTPKVAKFVVKISSSLFSGRNKGLDVMGGLLAYIRVKFPTFLTFGRNKGKQY